MQLVRGSLIVHGLIAWAANGRCGIKFSGTVDVQQWRASPAHAEQQRVDEIVRLVKAGAVPLPVPSLIHPHEATPACSPQASLSADLQRVSELLKDMEAVLASDEDVIARHGTALQKLDIAMQILAVLDGVATGDLDLDIESTKMASLRRSADQALKTTG